MTSASDEKWRAFNCFFQSGRAKDLSAPLYLHSFTFLHIPLKPNNSQLKFVIKLYCHSTGRIRKTDIAMQALLPFSAHPLSGVAGEHLNGTDDEF